ncbi:MAG TPA: pyridoxal-dependent decarboxylase [Pyrinomonadaceae bacterium]|nr:pyridoxal-dependent decarboxylase [Pyrinomonadaceae bacterium]
MSLRTQSSLDVNEDDLQQISSESTKLVFEYLTRISGRQVRAENHAGKTLAAIDTELSPDGRSIEQLIGECRTVMDLSRHNGHPRFFGYVASPSTPVGAYADLIASALNSNITCWRSGSAGTEIERMVVRWLGALINYDRDAKGLLTSGGSMANMIALLIAHRRKSGVDTARAGLWNSGPPMTLYASEEVHLSIAKAADILGFGRDQVRVIACDERQRMRVDVLRQKIEADRREGLRPFCLVGSAGTTNTGAVDPLNELADVAAEFDLWFHVDGAYGAPASLEEGKKHLFAGLERADSVSLDPHKWLYVPVDAGCLLFRDADAASRPFSAEDADYIKTHGYADDEAFAFWDYGVELSRRFRALKVWMTLQYYGSSRIAGAISEDMALAAYLGGLVSSAHDFELLAPVELSICCFRYVPDRSMSDAELDRVNERVMEMVQKGGRAYLSNATVNGKFALRACITNFRTTKADIEETIAAVRGAAELLTQRRNGAA